jgi:hypothetical protein
MLLHGYNRLPTLLFKWWCSDGMNCMKTDFYTLKNPHPHDYWLNTTNKCVAFLSCHYTLQQNLKDWKGRYSNTSWFFRRQGASQFYHRGRCTSAAAITTRGIAVTSYKAIMVELIKPQKYQWKMHMEFYSDQGHQEGSHQLYLYLCDPL